MRNYLYATKPEQQGKIILVSTVGQPRWIPELPVVNSITAASTFSVTDSVFSLISDHLYRLLFSDDSGEE